MRTVAEYELRKLRNLQYSSMYSNLACVSLARVLVGAALKPASDKKHTPLQCTTVP